MPFSKASGFYDTVLIISLVDSCRERGIHRRERFECEGEVRRLLLLSSRSTGAVDSLLDLSGDTVLGSVELGTDGTVLGESAADLLGHVSRDSQ